MIKTEAWQFFNNVASVPTGQTHIVESHDQKLKNSEDSI